ncbi:MAG: hypothetical protein V1859_02010 [archaeon]
MKLAPTKINMYAILAMVVCFAAIISAVMAVEPEGASITYISNSTKNATAPSSRNDSKGTITTLTLSAIQQNYKWKAYVGNVTGTLVLQDSSSYSIYEWTALSNPSGMIYITRDNSITWPQVKCANQTTIALEQENLNHSVTASDNINHTFSYTAHQSFYVGDVHIDNSTCKSVATWINNSLQSVNEDSNFQEILLQDDSNLVYAAVVEQNSFSYRNDNSTYDFQALVADSALPGVTGQSTYYFYIEISA